MLKPLLPFLYQVFKSSLSNAFSVIMLWRYIGVEAIHKLIAEQGEKEKVCSMHLV